MSSTPPLTQSSSSSSNFRVNYSEYVADITHSPRSLRKLPTTTSTTATAGIGHHINSVNSTHSNRPNQAIHQPAGFMPHYGGGAEKCARCSKSVYLAEKKVGAGRSFHSSCFNCKTCRRKLDTATLSEHKGEVYCKPCYTKQFGAHGLISGVTMSTEKTTQESRPSRRSSYGSDLDTPVVTYEQTRHRANSSENLLREDYGNRSKDDQSQKFPRRPDQISGGQSPSSGRTNGSSAIGDPAFRRPSSPIRFEPSTTPNRQSSVHTPDSDRRTLISHGEKMPYGSGASAMVNIPVVVNPKRTDTTTGRVEIPTMPTRHDQPSRSRSPSPSPSATSNDSYRRQSSREHQIEPIDHYSRVPSNPRPHTPENTIHTIAPGNPLVQQGYRQSSSYESKYTSSASNASNYRREQSHSRESSPTAPVTNHRSPSPTSVQIPSTNTYRPAVQRDLPSTSSPFAPPPRHEYHNIPISTNTNPSAIRRSPSPQRDERRSSALNEFMTKTNLAGKPTSPAGGQFSALGALAKPRYQRNSSDDESDH